MNMPKYSMFETLMSLPMFKGVSRDQISSFVEKTNLLFRTYQPGERIVTERDNCRSVKCLISGEMEVVHPLFAGRLVVRERVGSGRFIGLDRLFGLNLHFNFTAHAVTKCGTMEFSKAHYMALLQSNQIYLMNCLNYLSLCSQRAESAVVDCIPGSAVSLLARIVDMTTTRDSGHIEISATGMTLRDFLRGVALFDEAELDSLCADGVLEVISPDTVMVADRKRLLDLAPLGPHDWHSDR